MSGGAGIDPDGGGGGGLKFQVSGFGFRVSGFGFLGGGFATLAGEGRLMRMRGIFDAKWILVAVLLEGGMAAGQEGMMERLQGANEKQLAGLLKRFPAADANGDGVLTTEEAVGYAKGLTVPKAESEKGKLQPTLGEVSYGPHERNVLDFWQAEGEGARPVVVFIHGGGFTSGDKAMWRKRPELAELLENGVSCAAINYRFRESAPIQDILRDGARAVQYLRSQAGAWGIDPERIAGWGGSAGAGTSLWLATRDDLADAENADPVLRQSSRLQAAVLQSTQATYDLTKWESFLGPADPAWWKDPNEMATFYHLATRADLEKPEALPILQECDMLRWISAEDAPLFINNNQPNTPSTNRGHYLHHPAHAHEIEKCCAAVGVRCEWVQGDTAPKVESPVAFVLEVFGQMAGE